LKVEERGNEHVEDLRRKWDVSEGKGKREER
jgi:hypothetical protein